MVTMSIRMMTTMMRTTVIVFLLLLLMIYVELLPSAGPQLHLQPCEPWPARPPGQHLRMPDPLDANNKSRSVSVDRDELAFWIYGYH